MAADGASMNAAAPEDVQATFCATLVDEWVAQGLQHAVVAPGSRSTPMALALSARDEVKLHVAHDERTASFIALGIGLATGAPAALLCTSGTAATHFHGAVVEAGLAGVPMLVLTADRPPELHGIGAPQTIDQFELYGDAVRLFVDAGVADPADVGSWRDAAALWWDAACGPDGGAAHVNLPFREPLVGRSLDLPARAERPSVAAADEYFLSPLSPEEMLEALDHPRGVIVAGRGIDDPASVAALAETLGFPVLADPRSGCRMLEQAVCAFDVLLRHPGFAADHRPDVVVHLGEPPASKVVGQWLAASGAVHVQVNPQQRIIDPQRMMTHRVFGEVRVFVDALRGSERWPVRGAAGTPWLARWQHAERAAQATMTELLEQPTGTLTEPAVARVLSAGPSTLVLSSSMPVRDVEWFGAPSATRVFSNRGANGIDGVVASAIGVAAGGGGRTVLLIGDVALLHDQSSLTALARRELDLCIVVVDNDGGGIFSFLPQATSLAHDRFEQLFGTPHGTDLELLARAHGLEVVRASTVADLRDALDAAGTRMVIVRSDRTVNVADHQAVYDAVARRLG